MGKKRVCRVIPFPLTIHFDEISKFRGDKRFSYISFGFTAKNRNIIWFGAYIIVISNTCCRCWCQLLLKERFCELKSSHCTLSSNHLQNHFLTIHANLSQWSLILIIFMILRSTLTATRARKSLKVTWLTQGLKTLWTIRIIVFCVNFMSVKIGQGAWQDLLRRQVRGCHSSLLHLWRGWSGTNGKTPFLLWRQNVGHSGTYCFT